MRIFSLVLILLTLTNSAYSQSERLQRSVEFQFEKETLLSIREDLRGLFSGLRNESKVPESLISSLVKSLEERVQEEGATQALLYLKVASRELLDSGLVPTDKEIFQIDQAIKAEVEERSSQLQPILVSGGVGFVGGVLIGVLGVKYVDKVTQHMNLLGYRLLAAVSVGAVTFVGTSYITYSFVGPSDAIGILQEQLESTKYDELINMSGE